jgi:opacity protein-like surface antigen
MRLAGLVSAAAMVLAAESRAAAQSSSGAIASGSVAAVVDDSGTDLSLAGSLGYRFNRVIGMGVELTWMRPKSAVASPETSPYANISYAGPRNDLLLITTNVRIEIPTISQRILPYAVGGGGPASTRSTYSYTIAYRPVPQPASPGVVGAIIPVPLPEVRSETITSTGLGLTLGGGVSFLATDHLSIDIDLRSFYIRGDSGGSLGRFGAGASWRF